MGRYLKGLSIRSRSLADIYYGGNRPRTILNRPVEQGYQPAGHLAEALRAIAEARRNLERRHPKSELPTREEIDSKIKDNPDKIAEIEISGKKFDIDLYNQRLISKKDQDNIPFDHLETREERKMSKKRRTEIEPPEERSEF